VNKFLYLKKALIGTEKSLSKKKKRLKKFWKCILEKNFLLDRFRPPTRLLIPCRLHKEMNTDFLVPIFKIYSKTSIQQLLEQNTKAVN
jgi:hypothetical protein